MRILMSRVFRFNGPVTYIENNYERLSENS